MTDTLTAEPATSLADQLAEVTKDRDQYKDLWWRGYQRLEKMEETLSSLPDALNQLAELHVAVARQNGYRTDEELLAAAQRNEFARSIGTEPRPSDVLTPWQQQRAEQLAQEAQAAKEQAEFEEAQAGRHKLSLSTVALRVAEMQKSREVVAAEAALAAAQGNQRLQRDKLDAVGRHDELITKAQAVLDAEDGAAAGLLMMTLDGAISNWRDTVR